MFTKSILMLFITICLINVSYANNHETYLCIASKATGFSFDLKRKNWNVSDFHVDNEKKLIEKVKGQWYWKKFGLKDRHSCKETILGTVTCTFEKDPISTLKFNIKTMRYIFSDLGAYYYGDTDGTPYIEIGTCTHIDLK